MAIPSNRTYKSDTLEKHKVELERTYAKWRLQMLDKHLPESSIAVKVVAEEGFGARVRWYRGCYSEWNRFNYSCGIGEMQVHNLPQDAQNIREFLLATYICDSKRLIVASINEEQEGYQAILEEAGFKVVVDWGVNPNSDNQICMLVAELDKLFGPRGD